MTLADCHLCHSATVEATGELIVGVTSWRGLGITAYGGAPVTPRFATRQGDVAGGGRVFWRRSFDTEVGLSFIEVLDCGLVARQDIGADARVRPTRTLHIRRAGKRGTVAGRSRAAACASPVTSDEAARRDECGVERSGVCGCVGANHHHRVIGVIHDFGGGGPKNAIECSVAMRSDHNQVGRFGMGCVEDGAPRRS